MARREGKTSATWSNKPVRVEIAIDISKEEMNANGDKDETNDETEYGRCNGRNEDRFTGKLTRVYI